MPLFSPSGPFLLLRDRSGPKTSAGRTAKSPLSHLQFAYRTLLQADLLGWPRSRPLRPIQSIGVLPILSPRLDVLLSRRGLVFSCSDDLSLPRSRCSWRSAGSHRHSGVPVAPSVRPPLLRPPSLWLRCHRPWATP